MNALLYAQLLVQYGIPLANQFITWIEAGKTITSADSDTINALSKYRSADALAAAGIKIVDGAVVKIGT